MANTPYRKRNNGYEYLGQFITDKDIDRLKEYVKEMNNLVSSAEKYKAMEDNSKGSSQQAEYTKNFNAAMDKIQNRSKTFSIGMAKNLGEIKGVIQDYVTLINDFDDNIENMQKNTDKFIKGLQKSNTTKFDSSNNKNFKLSSDNLIDALTNTLSLRSNRENNDRNNATRKAIIDAVTNKYKDKNGIIDPDKQDDIVEEINDGIKSANLPEFGRTASVLNAAGVALKAFATEGLQLLKEGLGRQTSAFRDTFTGISVRTGMTRGEYYDTQWHTNNVLSANGMRGSMATSEVQNQISTLVQNGVGLSSDRDTMITNAIETALTHSIVPYLDTSNAYYQQLITNQPSLNKTIRGIGRATNDMLGSSVVAKEYLETMVNDLSPMSELAEQELGLQYAQATGYLEALRSQGMSDMEIGEIFNVARGIQSDLYGSLNSGNVDVVTAVSELISNPNLDPANISDIMQAYAPRAGGWANNSPEGRLSPLYASILSTQSALSPTTLARMNEKNYDWDRAARDAQRVVSGVGSYAETATQQYKSGGNLTNAKIQEIYMENVTNELAVITEWLGHFMGPIQAIAGAVASYAGGKALKWAGGKLLGKAGSSVAGAGITGFANSGLGYNLMGSGSYLGINSVGGATAAGAAGVIGGGAMAIKGGIDVYKDFKNDDVTWKTRASAGAGAAGAVGAIALMAGAGPVGWAALGIGAALLAAREVGQAIEEQQKSLHGNTEAFKEQTQEEMSVRKQALADRMDELDVLRESVKETTNIEDRKAMLVEAGIATEKELADKKYDEIDAMVALIDTYQTKTKELTEDENETYEALQTMIDEEKGSIADKTNQFMEEITSGWGWNKDAKDLTSDDRAMALQMARTLKEYGANNSDLLTDDEKDLISKASAVTSVDDLKGLNEFIDSFDWHNNTARTLMSKSIQDGNGAKIMTSSSGSRNKLGVSNQYKVRDASEAATIITSLKQAAESGDKQGVENAVANLKSAGFTLPEQLADKKDEVMGYLNKVGIDKYRSGLNKVPYDDFPALLHENEAILTASTANELRGLLEEYRSTNEQNISFDAIIQQQTATLVERMDKIIQVVQGQASSSDLQDAINNSSRMGRIAKNMLSMKNISAFNN